ncbi:HEAT repeat domain-containing protein [Flindersiella endophytica]
MTESGASAQRPTPAQVIRAAVASWGEAELVAECATLVLDRSWRDKPDLLVAITNGGGEMALNGTWGNAGYWTRTWALRVMLYAWAPAGEPAVLAGLSDEHWRVREMAGKVAALRELGAAAEAVAALTSDPTPRVRAVAARALAVIGEAEHAAPLRALLEDPEPSVRTQASRALRRMSERLDRDLTGRD